MTVHDMYHEESIEIAAAPTAIYALITDLPRMGEWSPENRGGTWADGAIGAVGDVFHGVNRIGDREWQTSATVTVADDGETFQFVTGADADDGPFVRWTYRFAGAGDTTTVTEVWDVEMLPPTLRQLTPEQLAGRKTQVQGAMAATLSALKATAEA